MVMQRHLMLLQKSVYLCERCKHDLIQFHTRRWVSTNIYGIVNKFEDLIGLTTVKAAQQNVIQAENDFLEAQQRRREKQDEINELHRQLKEIHSELEKTRREDDRYIVLVTQEHGLVKLQRAQEQEFKNLEKLERNRFGQLSASLRDSHEKERSRAEQTKYWSIIGSIFGAIIGIAGTTISNRLRMKELKNLLTEASEPLKMQSVVNQLSSLVDSHHSQFSSLLKQGSEAISTERLAKSLQDTVHKSLVPVQADINQLKSLLSNAQAVAHPVESSLQQNEQFTAHIDRTVFLTALGSTVIVVVVSVALKWWC